MGWWKADPIPDSLPAPLTPTARPPPPSQAPSPSSQDPASSCPVDPKTRAIWLQQAQSKAQKPDLPPSHPPLPQELPPPPLPSSKECSSSTIDQSLHPTPPSSSTPTPTTRPLSNHRVISSIPRASPHATPSQAPSSPSPANAETETGAHPSGNWVYPSESQFFHAVMRKQSSSSSPESLATSISAIIPLHNAVNERAWHLIKGWEGDTSARCGGPKLRSFQGLGAGALSPKARLRSLVGYTEPFDRHDWVVERCGGERVEYVIDFYQGKKSEGQEGQRDGALNFFLDVRPKLNSWEGWRMRGERLVGWR